MESDLSTPEYLYEYGAYITENEIETSRFLQSLPQETIELVARTYTEGYRKGFEVAGIDLSVKKTVNIRYHIGFERIIREAIRQFADHGIKTGHLPPGKYRQFWSIYDFCKQSV